MACAAEVAAMDESHQATLDELSVMAAEARAAEAAAMAAAERAVEILQAAGEADGAGA